HRQDHRLDLLALGVAAYRYFTRLVPGDVGEVYQPVNAALEADEDAEVGDRLDVALDAVALGVVDRELFPRVRPALLDAERDPPALLVDVEDHDLHLIAHGHDLGRVNVLVGPVHLGDVHQAFHA